MKKAIILTLILILIITINLPVQAALVSLGAYQIPLSKAVSPNNAQNAVLAANILDGTVVGPGQIFSYNQTVGNRTTERGFIKGIMFGKGGVISDIGGGVCTTSSILHQAVKAAGLKVIERHNHSQRTSYLPLGEDAAVTYGIQDYKFKNNTNYPVLIESKVIDNNLVVRVNRVLPEKNCSVQVMTNDQPIDINTRIIFDNGISYIPLRVFAEAIGAQIYWDQSTHMVQISRGNTIINLTVNKTQAVINNQIVDLKAPARIIDSQTMIPVRSSCEALGLTVNWDQNSGTITAVNPNHPQDGIDSPVICIKMN